MWSLGTQGANSETGQETWPVFVWKGGDAQRRFPTSIVGFLGAKAGRIEEADHEHQEEKPVSSKNRFDKEARL
jgi:hypothetical protein